jgi:hypothetical protein
VLLVCGTACACSFGKLSAKGNADWPAVSHRRHVLQCTSLNTRPGRQSFMTVAASCALAPPEIAPLHPIRIVLFCISLARVQVRSPRRKLADALIFCGNVRTWTSSYDSPQTSQPAIAHPSDHYTDPPTYRPYLLVAHHQLHHCVPRRASPRPPARHTASASRAVCPGSDASNLVPGNIEPGYL